MYRICWNNNVIVFSFLHQIANIPESAVLQSAPYKCLQSQFSVLYGEVTQVGQKNY